MSLVIDLKETGRMPVIGVRGSLSFYDEADMRKVGAVYRSRRSAQSEWGMDWQRSHWDVPAPLLKRFFEGNGTIEQPRMMRNWESFVERDAAEFYAAWRRFERVFKLIKEGDEATVNTILSRHGIADEFFSRPPLPHQRAGLAFFFESMKLGSGHVCLFDEMRTGKTFQAIHIAKYLLEERLISAVLVIVPNSIKRVWMTELGLDAPRYALFSTIIEGTPAKRRKAWESNSLFYILNYEACRMNSEKDPITGKRTYWPKQEVVDWMARKDAAGGYMLISDESHKLKNPETAQTRAVLALRPSYSVFMTGTPVANRPEDAYTMSDFVCPGILGRNIWSFRDQFAVKGGYKGKQITGYKNLGEVKYRLARISMRRKRSEIMFDRTLYQTRTGQLTGKQKKAYESMRERLWAEVMNEDGEWTRAKANTGLSKALRLYQISDGYLSPEPDTNVWFDENWKVKELDSFIADYLDDIGKLVIWSRFVPPIEMLTERYAKYGAVKIRGAMKKGEAADNMYRFQRDPDCRIMVANILSAEGKGFQPASFAVMYDKWLSPHMNQQARDRIVGIKNPVTVTIISLVTEKAIDERVEVLLEKKKEFSDTILGDQAGDIKLPVMDKKTLLYLLATPEECEKYREGSG